MKKNFLTQCSVNIDNKCMVCSTCTQYIERNLKLPSHAFFMQIKAVIFILLLLFFFFQI